MFQSETLAIRTVLICLVEDSLCESLPLLYRRKDNLRVSIRIEKEMAAKHNLLLKYLYLKTTKPVIRAEELKIPEIEGRARFNALFFWIMIIKLPDL